MGLLQVLGGTSSQDKGCRLGLLALSEHVVPLVSELDLLELPASTEHVLADALDSGLEDSASGLGNSLQIVLLYSSGAEDISVREVLGGQVTDWKLRKNDLGS